MRRFTAPFASFHHHPRWLRFVVPAAALALLVVAMLSAALAQDGHSGHATTQFVAVDYAFEGPNELSAGWHNISLRNDGTELHHLQFARLNDDVTPDQFFQALAEQGEAALALAVLTGGVGIIPPGASAEVLVDFTQPGTYVLLCFLPNADGVPHLALGMATVMQVVGEVAADAPGEPTADFEVRMSDFAFSLPTSVPAGVSTWRVVNDGPQPHEIILMRVNDGVSYEEFLQALMEGGEADAPGVPIGGAQGLSPGGASYLTLDLEPGTYVALCFIPDPATGQPHLALGMVAPFTVEAAQASN